MPLSQDVIELVSDRYVRERDRYRKLTRVVEELCVSHFIESFGILANITARTKSPASLRKKLTRIMNKGEKSHWNTVDDVFRELSDLSGVRIALYSGTDQALIEAALKDLFVVVSKPDYDRKDKRAGASKQFPGYKATHCQVELRQESLAGENDNLEGIASEIQICTMMQHVWNEIEHDIGYKPRALPSDAEHRALGELSHLARNGDKLIEELIVLHNERIAREDLITDENSLVNYIGELFQIGRITFRDNVGSLFEILQRLNINRRNELRKVMGLRSAGDHNTKAVWTAAKEEISHFNSFLRRSGKIKYQLVARNSADPAMLLLLKHSRRMILDHFPAGRGKGRPTKIRSLATYYGEFRAGGVKNLKRREE